MESVLGLLTAAAAGVLAVWRIRAAPRQVDFLLVSLTVLMLASGVFLFSLLVPGEMAEVVQEVMGWALAGVAGALALLATVKGLEGLLDS